VDNCPPFPVVISPPYPLRASTLVSKCSSLFRHQKHVVCCIIESCPIQSLPTSSFLSRFQKTFIYLLYEFAETSRPPFIVNRFRHLFFSYPQMASRIHLPLSPRDEVRCIRGLGRSRVRVGVFSVFPTLEPYMVLLTSKHHLFHQLSQVPRVFYLCAQPTLQTCPSASSNSLHLLSFFSNNRTSFLPLATGLHFAKFYPFQRTWYPLFSDISTFVKFSFRVRLNRSYSFRIDPSPRERPPFSYPVPSKKN